MSSHLDFPQAPPDVGVRPDHPMRSGARVLDGEAGLVERKCEKLAIVGYATSTRDLAPFDDPAYEVVGLNQLYRFIPRADFWCDIHENWNEENVEGTDHEGWLRDCGMPVLMNETRPGLPTSVRFPIERAIEIGSDYFTSTISYLIAWSILQGYQEVALYGIDLIVGTEYEVQKACAEHWLGVAHGRGMNVRLPSGCALLKHSHRYGYEKAPSWGPVNMLDFQARHDGLIKERDTLLAKLHALDGALHEVGKYTEWSGDPPARQKWLSDQRGETMALLSAVDGAAQEVGHWKELLTLRSRGADVKMIKA